MTTVTAPTSVLADDWQLRGVCADSSRLYFDDADHTARPKDRTAKARALCAHCPVLSYCAAYALRRKEEYGIWGSLTEADRQHLAELGWADMADESQTTVDVAALRRRLRDFRRRMRA